MSHCFSFLSPGIGLTLVSCLAIMAVSGLKVFKTASVVPLRLDPCSSLSDEVIGVAV